MKIVVTGGSGLVGRHVIDRLAANGHEVTNFDCAAPAHLACDCFQGDVRDLAQLRTCFAGAAAVVHLAGIAPLAQGATPSSLFDVNCGGTYNVFQAAVANGIRRIVVASSVTVLGHAFGSRDVVWQRFPIDEKHPLAPSDAYSFSKSVVEEMGPYFARRDGVTSVFLRLPIVVDPRGDVGETRALVSFLEASVAALARLGDSEQVARAQAALSRLQKFRARHLARDIRAAALLWKLRDGGLITGWINLFAAIDARDAAQAFERSITADLSGSHSFYVNDTATMVSMPSKRLLALFAPGVGTASTFGANDSLVSSANAHKRIGFAPEHPVRHLLRLP